MLKFKLTENRQFIQLIDYSLNSEKTSLIRYFKKKSKKAAFNVMVDRGLWDGMDAFITKEGLIAVGLWREIYAFAEKTGYEVDVEGVETFTDKTISRDSYLEWVETLLDGIKDEHGNSIIPRDYQFEASFRACKYKFCTQELATSAGKTLIFFIYNSFLRDAGTISKTNKSLIIVPNISLVGQTAEKFIMYAQPDQQWNICTIGGKDKFKQEKFDDAEIVISTYQSLVNLNPNLFKSFSVVQVDEVHKGRAASIRDVLIQCKNWEYRLGLSGTVKIEEEFSDFFRVQEIVGPLVMTLSAKHLIDHGYSPNIKIDILDLKYDESSDRIQKYWHLRKTGKSMYNDAKDFGRDMLAIEKGIIFDSKERLDFISTFTQKLGKNTLILFSDVKNGYGRMIQDKLLEWNDKVFYIDGGVDSRDRDHYKDRMEEENGSIIVASFGTFATGIDLKNVHHIILSESIKSEIILRQAIGRGMRKLAEKNKVMVWDLVDQLDGYSVRHAKIREEIYREQKFPVNHRLVDLTKKRPTK